MGDYSERDPWTGREVGRTMTPNELEREAYRRELAARDHERVEVTKTREEWAALGWNWVMPPYAHGDVWTRRLLPEEIP